MGPVPHVAHAPRLRLLLLVGHSVMSGGEFHLEIIGMAEPDEAGALHFSKEVSRQLLERFCQILETRSSPPPSPRTYERSPPFRSEGKWGRRPSLWISVRMRPCG